MSIPASYAQCVRLCVYVPKYIGRNLDKVINNPTRNEEVLSHFISCANNW